MEEIKCVKCGKLFGGHTKNQVNMQLVIHTNFKHPKEQQDEGN